MIWLLLSLLLIPTWANAATGSAAADTFYVRPVGACTYNGDGLSYGCASSDGAAGAFSTFANIIWTSTVGVDDGDTLYVCGHHLTELAPAQDGTLTSRITLRGNCANDPGTIDTHGVSDVSDAIRIENHEGIDVRNFSMLTGNRAAILVISTGVTQYHGFLIDGNTIDNRTAASTTNACYGLFFSSGTNETGSFSSVTVSNNRVLGTSFTCAGTSISSGLIFQNVLSDFLAKGNYVADTSGVGLSFSGASTSNILITGNTFTHNLYGGIKIQSATIGCPSNVHAIGNLFLNNQAWEIIFLDTTTSIIAQNTLIHFHDGPQDGTGPTYGAFYIDNLHACAQTGNTFLNNIITGDYLDGLAVNYYQTRAAFEAGNTWNGNIFSQRGSQTNIFGFLIDLANDVTISNFSTWKTSHPKDQLVTPAFLKMTGCTSEATVAACKAVDVHLAYNSALRGAGVVWSGCLDFHQRNCVPQTNVGAYQASGEPANTRAVRQ